MSYCSIHQWDLPRFVVWGKGSDFDCCQQGGHSAHRWTRNIIAAIIEAKEGREVVTCDIPNAFVQTELPQKDDDGNRTIMKIRGQVVDILCEIDLEYTSYVVVEGKNNILCLHVTKAIYGMLASAMLLYRKGKNDLIQCGFDINPYDPCVANKQVNGH
jgi:hypothetical protein